MKRLLQTSGLGLLLLGLALPVSAQRRSAPDVDEPGGRAVEVVQAPTPEARGHDQDIPGVRSVTAEDRLLGPVVDDSDAASTTVAASVPEVRDERLNDGREATARAGAIQPAFVRDADQPVELATGRAPDAMAGTPGTVTAVAAVEASLLPVGRDDVPEVGDDPAAALFEEEAVTAEARAELPPASLQLTANYPNPFSQRTSISFVVPESGTARVTLYDMRGREVAVLFDGAVQGDRPERVELDASDLAAGVYIYALDHAGQRVSRQLQVVR